MGKQILIADDSPTVVGMVRHVLEAAGYRVLTAPDGLAAVNIALREVPDLVISDVEMPEMTGLQLCRLLKGDPRTSGVPFLILSVQKEQYQQFWGRETGADDYLPKPFSAESLLARVHALLARFPQPPSPPPQPENAVATRLEALERLNASLDRRLFELTVAHGISAIAATTLGERDTARAILERLSRLVDFSAGALAFAHGGALYLLIRKATHPKALEALPARLAQELPRGEGDPRPPVLLSGAEFVSPRAGSGETTLALQPLMASGRLAGMLAVARESERPFDEQEHDLLALVAGQAALVLENARLLENERAHAEALARQNDELRRLNRTITDMISTVTHDLRTPLSSVMGYLELVLEEPEMPEQQREYLAVVQRNADRMLHMVNDLLDLSRLEARRVQLRREPTDLRAIVTEVAQTLAPALAAKRQEYAEEIPTVLPPLFADPERLHQVLLNLVSNASKYTPEGGRIRVCVAVAGEELRIAVQDTGIGLSEEDQRQVFSKFFRAQRPELAGITGTGLGLAIVRTLVELHGGEVFVESKLNQGSTFGFRLPLAAPGGEDAGSP